MEQRLQLGRLAGIRIAVHWSVLLIALLLAWGLATVTLPDEVGGYSEGWYWFTALVAVFAFFTGLLAHELAHSVVARRRGVDVEDITLWLFGGVSMLHGEAKTPHDELRIALAGPAASLAIATGFGVLGAVSATVDGPALATAAFLWLALINVLLGVFNLVPAAPLDGGRVLHAIVWQRGGDRARATVVATRAGQRFGYVLIGAGVFLLLLGDLAALWFVFLGWFLLSAARAEATNDLLRTALAPLRARDVMTADPIVVPEDVMLDRLVDDWFLRLHCSAFPTVDDAAHVRGLVTLQQVRRVAPEDRADLRVADVADPLDRVVTCAPDEPLITLLERLAAARDGTGRALVTEGSAVVGIISSTDVRRALDVAALHGQDRPGEERAITEERPHPEQQAELVRNDHAG
jgi:Zn-dependent protease